MSRLQDRLRDLPPERYARGAHAAADLAIRAAELAGRDAPADALWLKSQSVGQLREQQAQRLQGAEKTPERESLMEPAAMDLWDLQKDAYVTGRTPRHSVYHRSELAEDHDPVGFTTVNGLAISAAELADVSDAYPSDFPDSRPPRVGDRFHGTVIKTMPFGAFVSLLPGRDGLVHISGLRKTLRADNIKDVVTVGSKLYVEIARIDGRGAISLVAIQGEAASGDDARGSWPEHDPVSESSQSPRR